MASKACKLATDSHTFFNHFLMTFKINPQAVSAPCSFGLFIQLAFRPISVSVTCVIIYITNRMMYSDYIIKYFNVSKIQQ